MPRDEAAAGAPAIAEKPARLILIATPLGNLGDLTPRVTKALATLPWIACEDTRVTRRLLAHVGGVARLLSVRAANEREGAALIISKLAAGDSVGYCTDAGTPGVSDPGALLVRDVAAAGYTVEALPGPSAVAVAVAVSGLVEGPFYFAGFLPARSSQRRDALANFPEGVPVVLYESPHRASSFFVDALAVLGDRACVVCRELSKMHEEIVRTTLGQAATRQGWRGEITVVIAAGDGLANGDAGGGAIGSADALKPKADPEAIAAWLEERLEEDANAKTRDLAREAATRFDIPSRVAYAAALLAKSQRS